MTDKEALCQIAREIEGESSRTACLIREILIDREVYRLCPACRDMVPGDQFGTRELCRNICDACADYLASDA